MLVRVGQRSVTIVLDLDALDDSAAAAWRHSVQQACDAVGVAARYEAFQGDPPERKTDFAYLVDSRALTRKLLLNLSTIFIQPSAPPAEQDPFLAWHATDGRGAGAMEQGSFYERVSLITSCFRGDEYLEGFLANMAAMEEYDTCEHLLIRPASPGHEHARLVEHVRANPGAIYIYLSQDPGLYEVWNLGVPLCQDRCRPTGVGSTEDPRGGKRERHALPERAKRSGAEEDASPAEHDYPGLVH